MQNGSSAGRVRPSPRRPASTPDPEGLLRGGELGGAGSRGCGKQGARGRGSLHCLFVPRSGYPCRAPPPPRQAEGLEPEAPEAAQRTLFPRPCVCERAGAQGAGRRQDDASVFVLPELANRLPSPGPLGLRRRPRRPDPPPHTHRPSSSSRVPSPQLHTTHPAGAAVEEPGSRATPAQWGPGPGFRDKRTGSSGAAAAGRERVGAAGGGVSAPPRGPPLFLTQHRPWPGHAGAREVGGGKRGGRWREDRGPRQLTLLPALARRHLTPPPAAGWDDSEAKGGSAGRPGLREGPLMAPSVSSATAREAPRLPTASEPQRKT